MSGVGAFFLDGGDLAEDQPLRLPERIESPEGLSADIDRVVAGRPIGVLNFREQALRENEGVFFLRKGDRLLTGFIEAPGEAGLPVGDVGGSGVLKALREGRMDQLVELLARLGNDRGVINDDLPW